MGQKNTHINNLPKKIHHYIIQRKIHILKFELLSARNSAPYYHKSIVEKKAVKMEILVLAYSTCHVILMFEQLLPDMFFTFQHTRILVFCIHENGLNTSRHVLQVPGIIAKICCLNTRKRVKVYLEVGQPKSSREMTDTLS